MTSPFGCFWKFQKCKYEHACHGAYNSEILNDTRITSKKLKELILNDTNSFNEICDESKGYKKTENRLCATCLVGYKRFGGSTKCEKCPPSAENRLMIGIGFLVLIIGSTIMVYMEISSETSKDDTADAVKKILLNFLQILSLAASFPLKWPSEISKMFQWFGTFSSAGTTLMIPDCELTHLPAAEAFYLKQWIFTFILPMIVIVCILVWSLLHCCCAVHCKLKNHAKDYTILSIVLLCFLVYPTIVKSSFSMLRCPWVGSTMYLHHDLETPCFVGAHLDHFMMLTIPQIVLYIIGLPVVGTMHLLRNKADLHEKKVKQRSSKINILL